MASLDDVVTELRRGQQKPPSHPNYYYVIETTVNTPIDQTLQFMARAVLVDNITSQWMYLPSVGRFVAPYTTGKVLPLDGTQVAKAVWQNPPGIVPLAVFPGQSASLSYTDAQLGPSDGSHLAFGQESKLITLSAGTSTVNLPNGTRSLILVVSGAVNSLVVTGSQSGANYYDVPLVAGGNLQPGDIIAFPVIFGADTSVSIAFAGGGSITVTAILDTALVIASGTATQAAVWQSPDLPLSFAFAVGAGAAVTLLAGVAGKIYSLHSIAYGLEAAVAAPSDIQWQDTGSLAFGRFQADFQAWTTHDWHGAAQSAAGNGIGAANNGGVGATLRGGLTYNLR